MNWRVISVGKPSFSWTREGVDTYVKRIRRFTRVETRVLKHGTAEAFERARGKGPLICLDERGSLPTTLDVAEKAGAWEMDRVGDVTVCIGGAEGLPKDLLRRADEVWSLGRMTLMHELALLVWMEQLYRVYAIKHNHPYHREASPP